VPRHRADVHARPGDVYVEADGWTVATVDDALAAHFEHTIAITANGPEILTQV
jgi:methionyl aminopeptidase